MVNRKNSFVLSLLLLCAVAGFAQSNGSQMVKIPNGTSLKLRANSDNSSSYQWIKDGEAINNATFQLYEVTTSGSYTVITFNSAGCESEISDPVVVIVDAPAALIADVMIKKTSELRSIAINEPFEYSLKVTNNGPETATKISVTDILPSAVVFDQLITPNIGKADYLNSSKTVLWQIDKMTNGQSAELRIKVKAIEPGNLKNTATVTSAETDPVPDNNTSEDNKQIIGIIIPNVFTPNDDGKNDSFLIPGIENYENEVTIINRWGGTIYFSKAYKNDWKGDGLNEGTYYYVVKVRPKGGKWEVHNGYVTLLRAKQ
ncbi:MAG: T9SS type B sorting domain-containing protein [Pedobacter sp.]|nr:MAG: T9SS type B sorting domain-containing protein [Pedobacter sp.]